MSYMYIFVFFICVWLYEIAGEGNGNPLQCSCLENSTDRAAWWVTVHGFPKSWTRLKENTHVPTYNPIAVGVVLPFLCLWTDAWFGSLFSS